MENKNERINLKNILLVIFAFSTILLLLDKFGVFTSFFILPSDEIGKKVIDFINNNLVEPGTSAKLISVRDMGSYYEILTEYQGNKIPVYATKDGKVLFLQAIEITGTKKVQQTQNVQEIPKRENPDVKVFIMSFCPFGIQAVKALLPVMKLLGDKADITIHYVDYIMHGEKEVYENLRQYCIQKEQKERFYDYMLCFVQSGDYEKCLKEAKIDINRLNICMNETDRKYNITEMLKDKNTWLNGRYPQFLVEKDLNDKYNVRGSPTIIVNDVEVRVNRSPEAFKQIICQAFINPPSECNQTLSSEIASPGIGPLSGGTSSSGSCS
jgi:glutaredoxin